ncbi:hypothetical protein LCI18_000380 [Fusarium solani-melongenae]|uniref:Uncharacterized protein n=1 Tax=Fusarium solani subsp. cucurbitae TaxID=2747967 RepID=A0ACD3YKL4_FUSSC|nr:hypothetical protein LCI18_000380 [Fusarium solani-melongenae]
MVNRGRPSKDCLPCRKRKLRCDLKAGTCGQCRRAGLECHGYRNPQDLVFRDQTEVARHKVLVRVGVPVLNLDMDTRCRDAFFGYRVDHLNVCILLVLFFLMIIRRRSLPNWA